MEFAFKGRGVRITDEIRDAARHKLSHLAKLEPRATLMEVEVIVERNPRLGGTHRIEGALSIPRKTFRAHGEGPDVPRALAQLEERLERQIRDHHGKRRPRVTGKGNGLESAHA
jgi:ribosomal subunit interface protein